MKLYMQVWNNYELCILNFNTNWVMSLSPANNLLVPSLIMSTSSYTIDARFTNRHFLWFNLSHILLYQSSLFITTTSFFISLKTSVRGSLLLRTFRRISGHIRTKSQSPCLIAANEANSPLQPGIQVRISSSGRVSYT